MASEQDFREVLERLARIEAKIEIQPAHCRDHAKRIERLESAVGRQNFIAALLGAIAAGAVLMLKYIGTGAR